jgi:hypothetical protein
MRPARANPDLLHNMSVPSTSQIAVARTLLPGLRLRVQLGREGSAASLRSRLGRRGWRAAWDVLAFLGDAPSRPPRARRTPEALERHLEEALQKAGVPPRVGVFLDEEARGEEDPLLAPAAALAALARRSGALYLPTRRLEPSLVAPKVLVLFFPEEAR